MLSNVVCVRWGVQDPFFPAEVPSCFYLADSFLALDKLLGKHLLNPVEGQTKAEKAGEEGKRIKKLMGSLRHLFRNSFLD